LARNNDSRTWLAPNQSCPQTLPGDLLSRRASPMSFSTQSAQSGHFVVRRHYHLTVSARLDHFNGGRSAA
jgi:hypothetical protein